MSRDGRLIVKDEVGEGGAAAWSSNGRYVTSAERVRRRCRLWVADTDTGRIIYHETLRGDYDDISRLHWIGDRSIEVRVHKHRDRKTYSKVVHIPATS